MSGKQVPLTKLGNWNRPVAMRSQWISTDAHEKLLVEIGQLRAERDGYKGAFENLQAEITRLRPERDGYKGAFENLQAEITRLRPERDGYKGAYEKAAACVAHLADRTRLTDERLKKLRQAKSSLPVSLASTQLCFMHIGKTGGVSIQHILMDALHNAEIYHASLPQFDEATTSELAGYDLVMGHFTFRHVEKLSPRRFLFAFLREPIERIISMYLFMRRQRHNIDPSGEVAVRAAQSMSFRQFMLADDPRIRAYTSNQQTKILAYDHRPGYLADGIDLLQRAEENLATQFSFVGITEHFDASVRMLSEKLSLVAPFQVQRHNMNPDSSLHEAIDCDDIDLARRINFLDLELYHKVRSDFEKTYSITMGAGPLSTELVVDHPICQTGPASG